MTLLLQSSAAKRFLKENRVILHFTYFSLDHDALPGFLGSRDAVAVIVHRLPLAGSHEHPLLPAEEGGAAAQGEDGPSQGLQERQEYGPEVRAGGLGDVFGGATRHELCRCVYLGTPSIQFLLSYNLPVSTVL